MRTGTASELLERVQDDPRARGRGRAVRSEVRGRLNFEGTGVVPLGWSDCAWDYEQGKGYSRWYLRGAHTIGTSMDYDRRGMWDRAWTLDLLEELGMVEPDLSDEYDDEWFTDYARPRSVKCEHAGVFTAGDNDFGVGLMMRLYFETPPEKRNEEDWDFLDDLSFET